MITITIGGGGTTTYQGFVCLHPSVINTNSKNAVISAVDKSYSPRLFCFKSHGLFLLLMAFLFS
ncbi:MAG: hypothetical protein ABIJ37_01130 [Pseudomonadota bacterium]